MFDTIKRRALDFAHNCIAHPLLFWTGRTPAAFFAEWLHDTTGRILYEEDDSAAELQAAYAEADFYRAESAKGRRAIEQLHALAEAMSKAPEQPGADEDLIPFVLRVLATRQKIAGDWFVETVRLNAWNARLFLAVTEDGTAMRRGEITTEAAIRVIKELRAEVEALKKAVLPCNIYRPADTAGPPKKGAGNRCDVCREPAPIHVDGCPMNNGPDEGEENE